uniref:ABC transmembrane type-1 domain-containing protein n=1 Tax=Globodera pallida TaxID=36090 RepID=A0A183BLC8_GLOPA
MDAAEFVGVEEMEEEKEVIGAVKIRVYVSFVRAVGVPLSVMIILSLLVMQMSKIGSDIWLSQWASAVTPPSNGSNLAAVAAADWSFPFFSRPIQKMPSLSAQVETNFYLAIYVGIAALNTFCTLIRAFLFAFGCILAAKRLHERILSRILNATLTWWDRTPCGRVTNRLSSDVNRVDDGLPFQLNIMLASLFPLVSTLLVTVVALPLLCPFVLLLSVAYFFLQRYYRRTTVELRRIAAVSLSPLYSHLSETVSGLVSIRALRITHRFSSLMRDRLECNLRAQFSQLACAQWLSVRTQMLGVAIVSVVAFASVFDVHLFHLANPGLIGLSITYALSFTSLFNGLLCAFIETEKELVSVERICDYVTNVPEETRQINGQIRFVGVSLRYAPDLPLAIRDVTFHVEAGHRVAVIGRTGSGKSTILQALLRAVPIESGKICVDGVIDLERLGLDSARAMFGYVSQHPFLFSGTLRDNLCLSMANSSPPPGDESLLDRFSRTGLGQWLEHFGGLSAQITEGGRNLSFGERQLISLLRLALSNPRIVLIDEATAHMDENNHRLISQLIAKMGCTVLAILHRTSGLAEFDWIIEMSNGRISRQGPPSMFFANKNADQSF